MIIPFASVNQVEHIEALSELVTLVEDYNLLKFVENIDDINEIIDFIKKNK